MPYADSGGVSIYYETSGNGGSDTGRGPDEPVVLLADAGYGAWQWSWQYPALAGPTAVNVPKRYPGRFRGTDHEPCATNSTWKRRRDSTPTTPSPCSPTRRG